MTAHELALSLNVADSTIALWRRSGMPCTPRSENLSQKARRYRYDLRAVTVWLEARGNKRHTQSSENCVLVKLDPRAAMPNKAHPSDVGYDVTSIGYTLYDSQNVIIDPDDTDAYRYIYTVVVDTGVSVKPPTGYYFELVPNSRIAKTSFIMCNSPGIIDPDYRGSVKACFRVGQGAPVTSLDCFAPGKVVAQLILRKQESLPFMQVDSLPSTPRGKGGFGSTAKKH